MNHKQCRYLSQVMAAALGLLVCAGGLRADEHGLSCTAADMKGTFATEPQGIILGGPSAGPFVAAGLLTFDGKSKFTGVASSSFNGGIIPAFPATGNFTVTTDCFISVLETTLNIRFEGYFTRDKRQVVFVEPDNGTITTNVLHRLGPLSCHARDLTGNWAIQATGTVVGTGQFAQNGRLTFDGIGKFAGKTASSIAGAFAKHDVAGTYNMNTDCTFTATFFDENKTRHDIFGVLYDRNEFYYDYRDPGAVIAGTGKASVGPSNDDDRDDR